MTKGLKIWLWIVLVCNALSAVGGVVTALAVPLGWLSVIACVLVAVGCAILLFQTKKLGFYIVCAGAVVSLVTSILIGANIIVAIISAVVLPLIIFLLMKNTWNEFQ